MSSSISMEKCPRCGREESLHVYYECRTGEYDTCCDFCGHGQHFSWKRDENYDILRKDVSYPLSEVYLMAKHCETNEILFKQLVTEIPHFDTSEVTKYLNHNIRVVENPDGINNFYWIHGDEEKRLYQWGDELDVVGDKMVVHEVQREYEENVGYGQVFIVYETMTCAHSFSEEITREQAMTIIEEEKAKAVDAKYFYATWYNPETKEFETLLGEYPEHSEELPF